MDGVFVTGVDTGVGKTLVSGGILRMFYGTKKASYWKPIQTGTVVGDDTTDLKKMLDLESNHFIEPVYRFPDPVSPHYAAKKWGKTVEVQHILNRAQEIRKTSKDFLIIEGAGGLLVPLNEKELQSDLIAALGFPVLIVATDKIGAINQSLLTIEACKKRKIDILGFVITRSQGMFGNAEAISYFGGHKILAEIPPSENGRAILSQVSVNPSLRSIFGIPEIPH